MRKICTKCCQEKDEKTDFPANPRRPGHKRAICKRCKAKENSIWYKTEAGKAAKRRTGKKRDRKQKMFILQELGITHCSKCTEDHPACLEFHHLGDKKSNVSAITNKYKALEEARKCVILCANCHRKAHWT